MVLVSIWDELTYYLCMVHGVSNKYKVIGIMIILKAFYLACMRKENTQNVCHMYFMHDLCKQKSFSSDLH